MTEIQIEIYCESCGGPLEGKWDALRQKLEVELCGACTSDGLGIGMDENDDERFPPHDDLEGGEG